MEVWTSARKGTDTKTPKSRRTLALPSMAVDRLKEHKAAQAKVRLKAKSWRTTGWCSPRR